MDQEPKYMFRPIAEDTIQTNNEANPSVLDHVVASSGLSAIRPHQTMSPTRPKLYSCWRRSEEAWSSTGSRHSSRPGSSTASSSRPPSQPNVQGAQVASASVVTNNPSLYCKSNNSSLSDVSVAGNFQQLSVSSQPPLSVSHRRALFKTQKWSRSFDQANPSVQAQMSPGRKRQVHSQQNKSLDLDSGYSGSWGMTPANEPVSIPTLVQHPNLCSPALEAPLESSGIKSEFDLEPAANRSLLPSFPESFKPDVNLIPAPEESLDDLDEEIKMIVARAEHREGLLSFLEDHVDLEDTGGTGATADLSHCYDEDLLCPVRPEPVRTRNPLLCQKSSSSSGYETSCISSVSDNLAEHQSSAASAIGAPLAPPRTKRGLAKGANKARHQPSPNSTGKQFKLFNILMVLFKPSSRVFSTKHPFEEM